MDEKTTMTHKLMLKDRKGGSFTGVRDVLSFDLNEILMETDCGMLQIKGKELHVSRLDLEKGEVESDGQVDALSYSQVPGIKKKGSLFGKLLSS